MRRISIQSYFHFRLNLGFLGKTLVLFLAVGLAIYFIHRHQARRLTNAYLVQADSARDLRDRGKEADYLRRYLALNPKDSAVRGRLGLLAARTARRTQELVNAFYMLQDAVTADTEQSTAIRREAVRIALNPAVKMPSEARRDLDLLLTADPKNPEYEELYAEAFILESNFPAADQRLTASIALGPTRVDNYARQAWLRKQKLNNPGAAAKSIEALLAANPNSALAHLIASEHHRDSGDRDKWAAELAAARKLDPSGAPVALAVADARLAESRDPNTKPDDARAAVADAVDLLIQSLNRHRPNMAPADPPPEPGSEALRLRGVLFQSYQLLVRTLTLTGTLDRAEEWAVKATEAFPESPLARLDRIDVYVSRGKLAEAEADLKQLEKDGILSGLMDFQRGRISVARNRWAEAARHLESAGALLITNPPYYRRANLALAECLKQTGEADRRYEAFRRAVPADPLDADWGPAVAGVAETLLDTGRPNEALAEYQRLMTRSRGANLPVARLLAGQQLRRPKEQQNWAAIDRVLDAATDGPEKDTLRGEILAARGEIAKADTAFDEAAKKHPTSRQPRIAKALMAAARGDRETAEKLLAELRTALGDGLDVRLAQAELAARAKPPNTDALQPLAAGAESWSPADRRRLLEGLASAATAAGKPELSRTWLDQLAALFPEDVGLRFRQFDVAVLEKDVPRRQAVVAEIAKLSGPESVPTRVVTAFDAIVRADAGDRSGLVEASRLLSGLERQRTGWSRLYLAQGRVADLQGDGGTAVRKYRQAVDLGERSPAIVTRLIELYTDRRMYAEADDLLRSVPSAEASTELRAQISVGTKDYARAADLALKSVPFTSTDAKKLRWLAQVMLLAERPGDAERALRQAVQTAPAQPEAWVALFQLLASTGRKPEVPGLLDAARAKLPPAELPMVLAQGYEAIGKLDECRKVYADLLAARPGDVGVLRAAAGFRVRAGDLDGARGLLESILKLGGRSSEDESFARRLLAVCLAGGTNRDAARRALEVLGFTDPVAAVALNGTETPDDLRVRVAALLAQPSWAARAAAAKLMLSLENLRPLAPDEQFLFGQILTSLEDWEGAVSRLKVAARANAAGSTAAAYLAEQLLVRGQAADARPWVEQVHRAEPNSRRDAILSARQAKADGRPGEEVEKPIEAFAAAAKQPLLAARLLEELGLPDRAEKFFRSAADGPGTGSQRLPLALFLSRGGRLTEGLAEIEKLRGKLSPGELLPVECEMFLQARDTAAPAAVKAFVERVEAAAGPTPAMQSLLAAALSIAGEYDRATAVSREILARDGNDLLALNNLAFLQATHGKDPKAALETVRKAMAVAGPNANLLDTEAVALIAAGDPAAAVERLRDAQVVEPSGVVFAHLAQAYTKAGRKAEAAVAASVAARRNFRLNDLHPLERPAVRETLAAYGVR